MKTVSATLALACLLGCSSAPPPTTPPDPATAAGLVLAEFAAAKVGFDERCDDAAWDGADEVVFALRLKKGDTVHHWLLTLEVVLGEQLIARVDDGGEAKLELWENKTWTYQTTAHGITSDHTVCSRMLPILVTVRDQAGTELTTSLIRLPCQLLGRGLLPAVEASLAHAARSTAPAEPVTADVQPVVEAMIAVMSLFHVVQEDDALADYFWQVVEKPSLWSVVTGLGVKATMSMPFEQSLPATRLPANLPPSEPAYVVPLRIDVNGSPALLADVVAVDARRPYALCGGMVAAVARHPSDPTVTFELQLIAAHCGRPQQATIDVDE